MQTKETDAGILHDITLSKYKVSTIFTKAGHYRWGKTYSEDKRCIILSGKCILTTESEWEDIEVEIFPGEKTIIPANTPNLFYFPEDTEMLEWFPRDAITQKVERYYAKKKANNL